MRGMTRDFASNSADATIQLGHEVAPLLRDSRLVLLRGDLGTGKTTLVKGIAAAFGAAEAEDVTSPTFTLVHEYHGPDRTIYHIDLYRIETQHELDGLGIDDLVRDENNLVLVEWGEKFPRMLTMSDAEISIARAGTDGRKLRLSIGAHR
jgi:tRNA threonylcarbamoyladenosine biosynthesis protein TsaE